MRRYRLSEFEGGQEIRCAVTPKISIDREVSNRHVWLKHNTSFVEIPIRGTSPETSQSSAVPIQAARYNYRLLASI